MRHGFVLPAEAKNDWLPLVHVGQAGVRVGKHLNSELRKLGSIAYGPYKYLEPGFYRLTIRVKLSSDEPERSEDEPCIAIQINAGADVFGSFVLCRSALVKPDHEFKFFVPRSAAGVVGDIEARILLLSHVRLSIQAIAIEPVPMSSKIDSRTLSFSTPVAIKIDDWLPHLSIGPLGHVDDGKIIGKRGPSGFVIFGPYWPLPLGHYEVAISIESRNHAATLNPVIRADVVSGDRQLVVANFHLDAPGTTTTIRLPFEMTENLSHWRQIETRIWSSGEEPFCIKSLSVKPLEQTGPRELLPYLFTGWAGQRTTTGIGNAKGRSGIVAYSPKMRVKPGSYRMAYLVGVETPYEARDGDQAYAFALVKYGTEFLKAKGFTLTSGQIGERDLVFEVPSTSDDDSGLEFYVQVIRALNITVCKLSIEPVAIAPTRQRPAVLSIQEWLPFLQRGKSAHSGENGVDVSAGVEEFVLYGPFWTLPPGRYDMRVSVVPNTQSRKHENAVVTAQVAAEQGARLFAESKWRLDRYKPTDEAAAVEFRLPFSLHSDLPAAARTIETRIFTPGDASFRIASLRVTVKNDNHETDWFPYLIVGECGVHTGAEIKAAKDKVGLIACTPEMSADLGHYKVYVDIAMEAEGGCGEDALAFEAWFGSDLIAIGTLNSKSMRPFEFDLAEEDPDKKIELRIRAMAPTFFSIRGLIVEKTSDPIGTGPLPTVLRVKNWLPVLEVGAAAFRLGQGVVARQGQNGFIVYGPYWPLAPGNYAMLLDVEIDTTQQTSAIRPPRLKNVIKAILSFAKLLPDGGADVTLNGRQIAIRERFAVGSILSRSSLLCVPFEIAATDVKIKSRLETRVWSTGRRRFRIRSLSVKAMPGEQSYIALVGEKIVSKMNVILKSLTTS